jgi:hypothetical protein
MQLLPQPERIFLSLSGTQFHPALSSPYLGLCWCCFFGTSTSSTFLPDRLRSGRLAIRPTVVWLLTTPSPFVEIQCARASRITARFYNDAGNVVVPAFAASSGNDDAMVLPPANRSEITAHLDIPSCQYIVSTGIWSRFHIVSNCTFS